MTTPFRLGNHEFMTGNEAAPLSRISAKNKKPIAGATPPPFLAGFVREPASTDAAKVLKTGAFCGHGEPTFTVFDIIIDGEDHFDVITFFAEDADDDEEANAEAVIARVRGSKGPWLVVYSSEWINDYGDLELPAEPQFQTFKPEEDEEVMDAAEPSRLAIGFEYPPDADGINEISWLAIDAWPDSHKGDPFVLVSIETA